MIEVSKWIKGINKGDFKDIFRMDNRIITRGNGLSYNKYRLKKSSYWFGSRVVNEWNNLDRHVVAAKTLK